MEKEQKDFQKRVKDFIVGYNKLCTKYKVKLKAIITKNGPDFELINTKK